MRAIEKIDFVVLWVDDNDKEWLEEKAKFTKNADKTVENDKLYRDYGTFHYWFRMVEKHAPWVHKIHLVTNGQVPDWLDAAHPKLNLVKHADFMPKEYLPTFNAAAIELNLHRIPELSEQFVLFNDDMFLVNDVRPEDFFVDGKPKLMAVYNAIVPAEAFDQLLFNNVKLIKRHFPAKKALKESPFKFFTFKYGKYLFKNIFLLPWDITGYHNPHLPAPIRKSTLDLLWTKEKETLGTASCNHIRNYATDVNQYICHYWQIETNQFEPFEQNKGAFLTINEVGRLPRLFKSRKVKMICINDTVDIDVENLKYLQDLLLKYYPVKSHFEK
ncbi:Stealth CR1 domain-containing protein [Streptococcus macacae]|uniref:Exopolysaccharide phosphotransferase cps2G family protein n=1 Tax=Streptococcus macacae NCTC 11558 TaxID=764298 RepID=G5JUI6_9STRE|nr:Stealth CR1 domain-containing protein [Streptococcus macacae]EHJ52269.1 exopolysaccharide phosphotransferase cps2G family protein [Streptococcus macacae NCTC 11558]